jgi:ribonuclease M5
VKHAYIPDIYGKEHRKRHWGAEQKLGVEGMSQAVLELALRHSGATFLNEADAKNSATNPITKADLYLYGLTGGDGSANLRQRLLKELGLPEHLSTNSLLPVLNALYVRDEFLVLAARLKRDLKS